MANAELRIGLILIHCNNRIYIVPHGRNIRGAGGRSDQHSVKTWVNKNSFNRSRIKNRQSYMARGRWTGRQRTTWLSVEDTSPRMRRISAPAELEPRRPTTGNYGHAYPSPTPPRVSRVLANGPIRRHRLVMFSLTETTINTCRKHRRRHYICSYWGSNFR